MKKNLLALAAGLALIATPFLQAQPRSQMDNPAPRYDYGSQDNFGPRANDWEFTLGGGGATNQDFDDSFGGVSFSVGKYLNDTLLLSLRQNIDYSNPSGPGGSAWMGATRIALDQHILARGPLRPFVGVNFGGFYGDNVADTWAAGLEAGAKYYVKPQTFIFALVDYAWLFRNADSIDNNFDDGAFSWSLGIGFNF